MGDMSGGGGGMGGGKAGGAGGGMPADASGGLGLGGDPTGGFDPTGGMGGSLDPMSGFGGDPTGGAFSGIDPSTQASLAMQGPQGLTQPPITDQPSAASPGAPQAAPAPPPPPQLDKGQAFLRGMSAHPEWGFNQTSEAPWTPGGTQVASADTGTATDVINQRFPTYPGGAPTGPSLEDSLRPPNQQGPVVIDRDSPLSRPPPAQQGDWSQTFKDPNIPDQMDRGVSPDTTQAASGKDTITPDRAGAVPGGYKPWPTVDNPPDATGGGATIPGTAGQVPATAGGVASATPQATPPGTTAPAGSAPQSPLEQLVSGFLHMLFGGGQGGLGPLEQLIARFLGINPRRLFPQFYGGGFNRPAGPGYFPPGTVGGRGPLSQGAPQAGRQTPPGSPPGSPAPPSPQRLPSALAPSRRQQGGLPGGIYTAGRPDQPPPWHRANQGARQALAPIQQGRVQSTVGSTLQAAGASNNAIAGIMANINSESAWNPGLRHPDQPHFGGEAHFAHGLYQEGGDNWNRYQHWLGGRDWRDPRLQTQFLAENLKQNYPRTWARMNAAQTPGEAARIFLDEYLRPATKYRLQRERQYSRGVPAYGG